MISPLAPLPHTFPLNCRPPASLMTALEALMRALNLQIRRPFKYIYPSARSLSPPLMTDLPVPTELWPYRPARQCTDIEDPPGPAQQDLSCKIAGASSYLIPRPIHHNFHGMSSNYETLVINKEVLERTGGGLRDLWDIYHLFIFKSCFQQYLMLIN